MVTYLLSAGYTSTQVGLARISSVAFEVLANWVAPWLMVKIGPVRAGLWLSDWQVISLAAGLGILWPFLTRNPVISASGLVIGQSLADSAAFEDSHFLYRPNESQDVEHGNRGAFSTVEAAWQNAFELLSYYSTIIFVQPEEFKYPTLISVIATAGASACYALYIRLRRGHLIHFEILSRCISASKGKLRDRELGIERITSGSDV